MLDWHKQETPAAGSKKHSQRWAYFPIYRALCLYLPMLKVRQPWFTALDSLRWSYLGKQPVARVPFPRANRPFAVSCMNTPMLWVHTQVQEQRCQGWGSCLGSSWSWREFAWARLPDVARRIHSRCRACSLGCRTARPDINFANESIRRCQNYSPIDRLCWVTSS